MKNSKATIKVFGPKQFLDQSRHSRRAPSTNQQRHARHLSQSTTPEQTPSTNHRRPSPPPARPLQLNQNTSSNPESPPNINPFYPLHDGSAGGFGDGVVPECGRDWYSAGRAMPYVRGRCSLPKYRRQGFGTQSAVDESHE